MSNLPDDTIPARDLTPNRHTDGRDYVNLTVVRSDTGRPWQLAYLADEPVTLATPGQVADAGAAQRREELAVKLRAAADQLHRLADDVLKRRLPVPHYQPVPEVRGVVSSRDELERWAAYLGESVRVSGADDLIPAVDGQVRAALAVHMQSGIESGPVEMLTPDEWQERTGVRVLDADGWADGKSWTDPIWEPEWQRRMSASTVERRTADAETIPHPPTWPNYIDDRAEDQAACLACRHDAEHRHDAGCEVIDGYGRRCGCPHFDAPGSDGDR